MAQGVVEFASRDPRRNPRAGESWHVRNWRVMSISPCIPSKRWDQTMTNLYESPIEASAHEDAIASLIEETHLPEDIVRRAYENELVQLKPGARVKDYLLLFTVRKTREALRTTQS
jgi:hypothetical protein